MYLELFPRCVRPRAILARSREDILYFCNQEGGTIVIRPRLVRDGMFLVGLDIADDKLMEINVFSPGGLYSA